MCILVWSLDCLPEHTLLLASNRDEFLSRPTTAARFWTENSDILAGRDGMGGGTWLGVSKKGRLAFLTNHRELHSRENAPSRGELVTLFLQGAETPMEYLQQLSQDMDRYNGFNLVVMDLKSKEMVQISNRPVGNNVQPQLVLPGVHAISNASLDTPWPKVLRIKEKMQQVIKAGDVATKPEYIVQEILRDNAMCVDDSLLPNTGYSLNVERTLSSIFVTEVPFFKDAYGTRSMTVVSVSTDGKVCFYEEYLEDQIWKKHSHTFTLDDIHNS